MSKYDPLRHYLVRRSDEGWRASFGEIESVLGFALPASARKHPAWWANDATGHSHARAWLDAGWRTGDVDIAAGMVQFRRVAAGRDGLAKPEAAAHVADAPESRRTVSDTLMIDGLDHATLVRLETRAELSGRTVEAVARDILAEGARLTGEEKAAVIKKMRAMMPTLHDVDVPALVRSGRDDEFG